MAQALTRLLASTTVLTWLVGSLVVAWFLALLLFWFAFNIWPRCTPGGAARTSIILSILAWMVFIIFLCPPVSVEVQFWGKQGGERAQAIVSMSFFAAIGAIVLLLAALMQSPRAPRYRHEALP